MTEWLDHLLPVQGVLDSKRLRPVTKCEERISQLSVIAGKRNHKVWSHLEEGPGSNCRICLSIKWALFALHINQYREDSKAHLTIPITITMIEAINDKNSKLLNDFPMFLSTDSSPFASP